MLIGANYYFQTISGVDTVSIIVKNNYGQQEIIETFTNKTSLNQELETLRGRLNSTGLYKNGLFYPKTGELISKITSRPVRKKILIENEYLRS